MLQANGVLKRVQGRPNSTCAVLTHVPAIAWTHAGRGPCHDRVGSQLRLLSASARRSANETSTSLLVSCQSLYYTALAENGSIYADTLTFQLDKQGVGSSAGTGFYNELLCSPGYTGGWCPMHGCQRVPAHQKVSTASKCSPWAA